MSSSGAGRLYRDLLIGAVWALVYWQTRSLRWPLLGHFLQDLFAPPILVFLNLLVIPG